MKILNIQIGRVALILTVLFDIWTSISPFYIPLDLTTEFAHCRQGLGDIVCTLLHVYSSKPVVILSLFEILIMIC